jgi:hypothetical protein
LLYLILVTKALKNIDTQLSSSGELIEIDFVDEKSEVYQEVSFDKILSRSRIWQNLHNLKGQFLGVDIYPKDIIKNSVFSTVSNINKEHDTLHKLLGHPSDPIVKQTSKMYGIKINEPTHPCKYFAQEKHLTMIPKPSTNKATSIGEHINIDISCINTTSFGVNKCQW